VINDNSPYIQMINSLKNEWMPFIKRYEMVLNELESDFTILDLEWKATHGYSPIEHIKTRLKNPISLVKKIEKKGVKFNQKNIRAEIKDIAGIRIVTSFMDDVYMLLDHIQTRQDLKIIAIKDYIKNPKSSGYRSVHVIVESQVILSDSVIWVPAEIQIRTLSMDFWASLEHKLQYKYKQSGVIPLEDQELLQEIARSSFEDDVKMSTLRQKLLDR